MGKLDKFIIDDTTYEIVPEIAPLFSASTAYSKGDCVIYNAVLYKFTSNHSAGNWTGNDVEVFEVGNKINKISDSVAPEFDPSASYTDGQYVYKNGVLYRFMQSHSGAWTGTDVEEITVGEALVDAAPTDEQVETSVFDWLDEHPEATTTVQDGSLTETKFSDALKLKAIKDYVTPEMYGAKGDGVTDDTAAIQSALDSGKTIKLSKKIYLISAPLHVSRYTTVLGDGAGWISGATTIRASNDFSGDYMVIISYNTSDYCRSVNIYDINFDCNSVTGGINAIHLYDASILENINITQIGAEDYGINIEFKGKVTQTLLMANIFCVADTVAQRDGTKAIINLERLQECTLINVKAFANNSNSFDIFGCETLTLISCASYDYAHAYKAFNFGTYARSGFGAHNICNITMIGCLNEGNPMGLYIDGKFQYITGTFAEYAAGTLVTQNDISGIIASGSESNAFVYPINGDFTTGSCSIGEISTVSNQYSEGFTIDYQPKISTGYSSVTIKGVSNSVVKINRTIGVTPGVQYNLENNYSTRIEVSPNDVRSMTTDYTSEISPQAPVVLFTGASGGNFYGLPPVAFEGLKVVIYSTKDKYDCKLRLTASSIYNTNYLSFNYFTKAALKVVKGQFVIEECDGCVIDRTNGIYVWDGELQKNTLAATTTNVAAFLSNAHYINTGAQDMYTINMNASFIGKKIIVSSVNDKSVSVNLISGVTLPDGSTTNVVVQPGETKTFISLIAGIVNVL